MAIEAGADAIGFVGVRPPNARTLQDDEIARIIASIPASIETVLLSSGETAEAISAQVQATGPTTVQILRPLAPDQLVELAEREPAVRRVQVVHVQGPEALAMIAGYAPFVDAFLLDSGKPQGPKPQFGGTGAVHDWSISAEFVRRSPRPVFLAGGLSAANAEAAIAQVRPFGLDLCTGLRAGGRLDARKLVGFIAAVRRADASLNCGD